MIYVPIYVVPFGDVSLTKLLADITIVNDGTGTELNGNYVAIFRDYVAQSVESLELSSVPREEGDFFTCVERTVEELQKRRHHESAG